MEIAAFMNYSTLRCSNSNTINKERIIPCDPGTEYILAYCFVKYEMTHSKPRASLFKRLRTNL